MKTISENILTTCAILVTTCVVAICGYLFFANVGQRWAYVLAIATLAVAWIARRFSSGRSNVTTSLVLSGVLLSVALGAKALEHLGWVGVSDIGLRMNGIITGLILVAFSNAIPKQMSSAPALAMLRTVGGAFVIGGFGYALAWLLLPLSFADNVAIGIVLISLVVAATAYIGWRRNRDRSVS